MGRLVATITLRILDLWRIRLLAFELRQLAERLRSEGSPHADTLEHIANRLTGDDESPDEGCEP